MAFSRDRSATIGLTLAARRAGMIAAMSAATESTTAAAANARGSAGCKRNRNVLAVALKYQDATVPIASPASTSVPAFRKTIPMTANRVAPRAMRTPISRVRWFTSIRHHAVDADRSDDEPQEAEQSEQQHADFALRESRRHHPVHRPDISKRNIGKGGEHSTLDRGQDIVWIAARPDHEVATEHLGLFERNVCLWQRVGLEADLVNVADDPDDCAVPVDTNNLADRIGVAEVPARRRFIDDHDG